MQDEDLVSLKAIHVAGTKGKGSTCAFIESILRHHGYKTLLYTSPHLIAVRERIRLNGKPLDEDAFSRHFFDVWDRLKQSPNDTMPTYFRFLTLMAFDVFLKEKVDVAIIEVGIGGAFDATNIINQPSVCAITSLGYDHQAILGNTLGEIAWHKAGIMKSGVPAWTVPQLPEAKQMLIQRANELGVIHSFVVK